MEFWTILLTIIAGALCLYYYFTWNFDKFEKLRIPFKKPIPLFGNMANVMFQNKSLLTVVQEVYDLHPDAKYVGFYNFSSPVIIVKDPELIKSITIKNADVFPDHKLFAEANTGPEFSKNLFALKGEEWKEMRALLSPAFTSSKMKMMFEITSECAINFVNYLSEQKLYSKTIDVKDTFSRYTINVIASTAFGITLDPLKDPDDRFYRMGKEFSDFSGLKAIKFFFVTQFPSISKMLNIQMFSPKTIKFFSDIVKDTIATRDEQGIVRPDMINLMMQARDKGEKGNLTIEDMTGQALIFLLGGLESPTRVTGYAALLLAGDPEVQEKLQAEIDEVLEENSGKVTYEALHAMKYLDAVVNETLRLFTPGSFLDRIGPKNFTLPPTLPGHEPVDIKPRQNIWIPTYSIHNDPKYYPNPSKFDPDRFSDENKSNIKPFTYFPFGLGPRICIANRFALMEVKLLLFYVLAKYNFVPSPKTKLPIKLNENSLVMDPEGGFSLKIEPRK